MLTKNNRKNLKFKFENFNADYIWEINPEDPHLLSDDDYGALLKNVFYFDPVKHDFDSERFKVDFDE